MPFSPRTLTTLADDLPFVPADPYEPRWLQLSWRAGLLMLLVLGVYSATRGGSWIWQDGPRIADDLHLRSSGGLLAIWSDPFGNTAHAPPLTSTLWWIEHALARPSPGLHRLVGLTLHGWTCVMLWLAMRRLNVSAAWLIAAAIAVHPALIASVAWPSRQQTLLGAALATTALWALLRARNVEPPIEIPDDVNAVPLPEDPTDLDWPAWTLFWLCAVATPLADPTSALALAALLPTALRLGRTRIGRTIGTTAAALATIALPAAAWHARHQPADVEALTTDPNASGTIGRCVEAFVAVPQSVMHALVPRAIPVLTDRAAWSAGTIAWTVVGGITAVAILTSLAIRVGRQTAAALVPLTVIATAWVGCLTLAFVPQPTDYVSDLAVYPAVLATITLTIGLIATLLRLRLDGLAHRATRWALGAIVIVGLGWLTNTRAGAFAKLESFWTDAVARAPTSSVVRERLASYLVAHDDADRAAAQLDQVESARRDVAWLLARGQTLDAQRRPEDAIALYAKAYELAADRPEVTIALAEAQRRAGRPNAAIELYEKFVARHSDVASIRNNLGLAYVHAGDADRAVASYEEAIRIDPKYVGARLNLANLLFDLGRFDESAVQLKKAVEIDPRNYAAFMTSGSMLYRFHQQKSAEQMFRVAASLDPESADAFDRLGITLAAQGNLREAMWSFTRASRLRPDDAAIREHFDAATHQAAAATKPVTR